MNDDPIDFNKKLNESKSNKAVSIEDRVIQCIDNQDCCCKYCTYRDSAAEMVVDFISQDMITFEGNTNSEFCSFDLKDIFFRAIGKVKEMEKEMDAKTEEE